MSNISYGDIYLVNFSPGIGHEYQKVRPAIVISSDELLKRANLITCIAVTSKTGNFINTDDLEIKKDPENNLMSDSVIKMHHICTFDKKRVHKYIGKAGIKAMEEITKRLRLQFNL